MNNYDRFYSQGGWNRTPDRSEARRLARFWPSQGSILEIGCGMGQDAKAISDFGFSVTGIDGSEVGFRYAQSNYPGPIFLHADLSPWSPPWGTLYDGIFCRGMSWFHYELLGVNNRGVDVPTEAARLISWLRPGGTFSIVITTNLSGEVRGGDGVFENPIEDFIALFERCGCRPRFIQWEPSMLMFVAVRPQ